MLPLARLALQLRWGACVGVCVRSLLALIGLGVALVAAPLALAGMLALRARDWLALPVLLGGALLPAGGALYVLAAERTSLALTGGVGINANLVPVALLAPLVLVPLLALLYGALESRRTPTRRALGRCASCA